MLPGPFLPPPPATVALWLECIPEMDFDLLTSFSCDVERIWQLPRDVEDAIATRRSEVGDSRMPGPNQSGVRREHGYGLGFFTLPRFWVGGALDHKGLPLDAWDRGCHTVVYDRRASDARLVVTRDGFLG